MRKIGTLAMVIMLMFLSLVQMVGCQEQLELPSESVEKGNPKLDSQLNQLVDAERGGGLPVALEDLLQACCVDIL